MQYTSQPFVYRESPNQAFHEAVAHAVGLNVGGPVHLQKIGLLSTPISASSGNSMINIEYLLNVALDKLPFMAFSLSVEKVEMKLMNAYSSDPSKRFFGFVSSVVAVVRVREGTSRNECPLVGPAVEISRFNSASCAFEFAFRRWREIPRHL